jgi:hypothetical protein
VGNDAIDKADLLGLYTSNYPPDAPPTTEPGVRPLPPTTGVRPSPPTTTIPEPIPPTTIPEPIPIVRPGPYMPNPAGVIIFEVTIIVGEILEYNRLSKEIDETLNKCDEANEAYNTTREVYFKLLIKKRTECTELFDARKLLHKAATSANRKVRDAGYMKGLNPEYCANVRAAIDVYKVFVENRQKGLDLHCDLDELQRPGRKPDGRTEDERKKGHEHALRNAKEHLDYLLLQAAKCEKRGM